MLAIASIIKLVAIALAAWTLAHFLRRRVTTAVETVHLEFWKSLGIGFVGAIVIPVTVIVLLLILVGVYAAIALALWYGLAIILSVLIAVIALGSWIVKKLDKSAATPIGWQAVAVGVIVYGIVWFVPFVGFLAGMLLWLAAFGAMLRLMKKEILEQR